MPQTSIHALWVDPLAFDPSENGAPYLPEKQQTQILKLASGDNVIPTLLLRMPPGEVPELAALVAVLRAGAMLHQSHHWQTRGPNSFGDHLLFERLYGEADPLVDQVAERAVGLGGESLVSPLLQASLISELMALWCSNLPDPVAVSLNAERCTLGCIEGVRLALEARGALSSGTDNLLQGVADKHEEFVYLLQQRGKSAYSYDRG